MGEQGPYPQSWPPPVGKVVQVGNRLYVTCPRCRKAVQINKRLLGELHVCV